MKLNAFGAGEDSEGVSEGLSLVQEQFPELVLLFFSEVAVHHSQQLEHKTEPGSIAY